MTMTHQSQDHQEPGRDERIAEPRPTLERPRGRGRRWSVAARIAAARVPGDHSFGA
jgi:hypothetical protein